MVNGGRSSPSFFKVMIGDFLHKVEIPRAFIKRILGEVPNKIILRSSQEKTWTVSVMKLGESFVLCNEWCNFAKYHALEFGDFLVFRYNAEADFTVEIFGRNCCEKKSNTAEIQRSGQIVPGKRTASTTITGAEMPLRKKNNTESNGLNRGVLPSCTVIMRPSYVTTFYTLGLPTAFARTYLKYKPLDVTLRLSNGSEWKVSYTVGTQHKFTKGWKTFAVDNQLKLDDVCSFEVVNIKGNHAEINASITRAASIEE